MKHSQCNLQIKNCSGSDTSQQLPNKLLSLCLRLHRASSSQGQLYTSHCQRFKKQRHMGPALKELTIYNRDAKRTPRLQSRTKFGSISKNVSILKLKGLIFLSQFSRTSIITFTRGGALHQIHILTKLHINGAEVTKAASFLIYN